MSKKWFKNFANTTRIVISLSMVVFLISRPEPIFEAPNSSWELNTTTTLPTLELNGDPDLLGSVFEVATLSKHHFQVSKTPFNYTPED